MFSSFRNRFGIPGVISVIALVFAMLGGAYAASDNAGSGKATASAKKAKKAKRGPRGPRGPKGPAGPAGPQGPAGPAGAKGDKGDTGAAGSNGSNGAVGPAGPTGPTGLTGKEGSPWTLDGVLPPGKTETGTWAAGTGPVGFREIPLSFTIPLAADLSGENCGTNPPPATCQVHYINVAGKEVPSLGEEVESHPACDGTAASPAADPGHLCIYGGAESEAQTANTFILKVDDSPGASKSGAVLGVILSNEFASAGGSWAVTAEEE